MPKLYKSYNTRKFIAEELGLGSWKANFLFGGPVWPSQVLLHVFSQKRHIYGSVQKLSPFFFRSPTLAFKHQGPRPSENIKSMAQKVALTIYNGYVTRHLSGECLTWCAFVSGQDVTSGPISCHHRFERIHHHRFNDGTALPFVISLVSLSNSCVLKLLHSLSSHDPILTKAGNPLAQISSPWCEALPNETLLVKSVLLLLLLLCLLVCLWAPVKAAIQVHEYADGRREQYSACTIFLLRRSCRIACTRNRLSKQILKHSRKWSTSIYSWEVWLLIRKGRYRKATLAKSML